MYLTYSVKQKIEFEKIISKEFNSMNSVSINCFQKEVWDLLISWVLAFVDREYFLLCKR